MYPTLRLEVHTSTVPEGFPYLRLYSAWLYIKGLPFWIIFARQVFLVIGFHAGFTLFINFRNAGFSGRLTGSSASITKSTTASVILPCSSVKKSALTRVPQLGHSELHNARGKLQLGNANWVDWKLFTAAEKTDNGK